MAREGILVFFLKLDEGDGKIVEMGRISTIIKKKRRMRLQKFLNYLLQCKCNKS